MTDERPDTIPERMRAIADHLDVLTKILLRIDWEAFTGSSDDAAEITEHLRGTEMQDDLRADADNIQTLLTIVSDRAVNHEVLNAEIERRASIPEPEPYDVRLDPLVPPIGELLRRFSYPRTYAGDYCMDFAVRIVEAINDFYEEN